MSDIKQLTVDYPDSIAEAVKTTQEEFKAQILLMAALKLFELGKLSSGKAAELAGLSRTEFLEMCGRYRIPAYNYPDEEIEIELRTDVEAMRKALS